MLVSSAAQALGLRPWLAALRLALVRRFEVFFDIGVRCYPAGCELAHSRSSSAPMVFTIRPRSMSWLAALSHP